MLLDTLSHYFSLWMEEKKKKTLLLTLAVRGTTKNDVVAIAAVDWDYLQDQFHNLW